MSSPTIIIERDAAAVAYASAHLFWQLADTVLTAQSVFRVALAGGHTPAGMYHEIVRQHPTGDAWRRLHFFFGDERAVPPDHPDSNYRMIKAALFDHAPLSPTQIHRMPGEQRPLEAAAQSYERELAGQALDLVLLGIGEDGHTASLFPGSSALTETVRWVLPLSAPPGNAVRERLTITLPCIAQAREAWFLVTGAEKARIVERIHRGTDQPPLPAAMVRAQRVAWLLDRAAGAALVTA
ncbi:MAG: 6-phosphogluconolactonase [Gemmatimonadaceae bacterium]